VHPGGLAAQPLRVVPGDEQQRGGVRADAVEAEQAGCAGGDQRDDKVIQPLNLRVEELHAPAQFPQRDAQRVLGSVTWAGPQGGGLLGAGVMFDWTTFGARIHSTVHEFERNR
jgi:hypothetical protein